jgi:hypothetical protein
MKSLKNIYKNKKICIIANGSSVMNYNIDYSLYDITVGINRIYHTPIFDKINILYSVLGIKDWHNIENMMQILSKKNNFDYLIACPWYLKYNQKLLLYQLIKNYGLKNKFLYSNDIVRGITNKGRHNGSFKKRPLSGIAALNHILSFRPKEISIFGYDFYEKENVYNLPQYDRMTAKNHDLEENRIYLEKLICENNITWHK